MLRKEAEKVDAKANQNERANVGVPSVRNEVTVEVDTIHCLGESDNYAQGACKGRVIQGTKSVPGAVEEGSPL